jgi:clan AA aspartic protease
MGIVKVVAEIGPNSESLQEIEFIVDTGAFYTFLSPAMCDQLALHMPLRERVTTADDRELVIEAGVAHIRINGREGATLVGKLGVPAPLLGVVALESLGYKVDPVKGVLEETRPFPGAPAL